ncbi:MAG: threonine ammonia-lyase [Lachnospiraceae bacterium]|nr:threonine ammonia-lyase [Lachnospiraceae bacterium]
MLTLDKIYDAAGALSGTVRKTPIYPAQKIADNLYTKMENLQFTGSFKIRGGFNKIRLLTKEERMRGVIACSAGNHAQGIAYSATQLGIRSIICMPKGAPISKVEATKGYGAEVVLVPGSYDDAAAEAQRLSESEGYTFAHPFDDEYVMAGQGTIGLEILEQLQDVSQIVCPVGGGGLISGIALAVKSLRPSCRVIGVQAERISPMARSLEEGCIVTVPDAQTIADGIHVLRPGDHTFDIVRQYVDDIVTVTEDEIAAAILSLIEAQKTVAEGAGATPVAACMLGKVDLSRGKTVCVVSGGNVDVTTLSRIITRGLTKSGRIVEITTLIPDRPGMLVEVLSTIAETGANVLTINHSREAQHYEVNSCVVSMILETRDEVHIWQILHALQEKGYETNV